MPNKNTFSIKPIKKLIEEEKAQGLWIDPYTNCVVEKKKEKNK